MFYSLHGLIHFCSFSQTYWRNRPLSFNIFVWFSIWYGMIIIWRAATLAGIGWLAATTGQPRWLPLSALAATVRAGCHWPRWLPLAALAATCRPRWLPLAGRAGCHWLWQADRLGRDHKSVATLLAANRSQPTRGMAEWATCGSQPLSPWLLPQPKAYVIS